MKIIDRLKSKKGISLADVAIAVLIFMFFTGIITTGFYNIYKHNVIARDDAQAINLAIRLAEYTDLLMYDEVTENLNSTIDYDFDIPNNYEVKISVLDELTDDETDEGYVKIIRIDIQYESVEETKSYSIRKLKVKEIGESNINKTTPVVPVPVL